MKFKFKNVAIAAALLLTLVLTACGNQGNQSGSQMPVSAASEKIILGNIITMDENKPRAEAVAVRDGIIVAVGTEEEARAAVSESAQVMDYKGEYIYPGFMEAHAHGMFAGQRAIGQADLFPVRPTNYEKYTEIIKKFIEDNPDKEVYVAAGWVEDGTPIDHTYLDNIIMDKPLIMNTDGGHSTLLNKKAMEVYGVNEDMIKKYGTECVRVDKDGNPTGYICEEPAIDLLGKIPATLSDIKEYILAWQDIALKEGITASGDGGIELISPLAIQAYKELQEEGKLKLRTFGYLLVKDNEPDPVGKVTDVVKQAKELNGEYFRIAGLKVFIDGVTEAHTAWLLEDYADQPGYRGKQRFNDTDKMVELLVEADKNNMALQAHATGDGGSRFMLDCIKKSQEITGNMDQRNVMAHLDLVSPEDIRKMADTNTIAAVAPHWAPAFPSEIDMIDGYLGKERSRDRMYPIKSFIDAGAKIVFHSDYPISPEIDIPLASFIAENRWTTEESAGGESSKRNEKEAISPMQCLEAVTTNVAYAFHAEDMMGSITPGKLANFTVCDKDLLECEKMEVANAKIMATIIDGDIVYKVE